MNSLSEVLRFYGLTPDKKGFLKCPIHNEKTASMKIYPDNRGFYCFGCSIGGSTVNFVMHLFNLNYHEAMKKLEQDFNLTKPSFTESLKLKNKEQERQKKQKELEDKYWKAFDNWLRLDENKRKYAPKNSDEPLHPLFVEALQKEEMWWYNFGLAELELRNYSCR